MNNIAKISHFISCILLVTVLVVLPLVGLAETEQAPTINSIQSAGNPTGMIDAERKASIYGTGLSGPLTVEIGSLASQLVNTTGTSDTYAEFIVPERQQSAVMSIRVINASGLTSNFYEVKIAVETEQAPTISSIQSAGNPTGMIDAERKASIYGTGLSGPLTVEIGSLASQLVNTTGTSDTYAEFIVPERQQSAVVSIRVINSAGLTSNFYEVKIAVEAEQAPAPKRAILITSPRQGGVVWEKNKTYNITWSGSDAGVTSYTVYLQKGANSATRKYLGVAYTSRGGFRWTIPSYITAGSDYRITLIGAGNTGDSSDPFSIIEHTATTPVSAPIISYLSPASGPVGAMVTIKGVNFAKSNDIAFVGSTGRGDPSSPVDGEIHFRYVRAGDNGKTLSFRIPSRFAPQTSESGSIRQNSVIPGTYYVVVQNENGKSIPVYFTVVSPTGVTETPRDRAGDGRIKSGETSVEREFRSLDEAQNRLTERRKARIRALSNRMVKRLDLAFQRIDKFAQRLESRLEKFDDEGIDTTEARKKLAEARATTRRGRVTLGTIPYEVDRMLESDNLAGAFSKFRGLVNDIITDYIKKSHTQIIDTIRAMKKSLKSD